MEVLMLRFPNPGSDIPSFIRIFQTLYTYLSDKSEFNLDDMSSTLTRMKLAASSGYVGEQALVLSTRDDRSRDPLYNQSKMYAELFRTLGWIVSDNPENALRFRFTYLGDHAAIADLDSKAIFEVSVLGINYPNRILAIKGTEASRVFSAILRVAARLDGLICRDEIIVGILNHDFVSDDDIDEIVSMIKKLRGSSSRLTQAISDLSEQIRIQINTMQNYTRFPLAVLTYCGWFEKITTSVMYPDGRPIVMFKLTKYGRLRVSELESIYDVRLSDFEALHADKQKALIRLGYYTMLQRANFDISSVIAQIASDKMTLNQEISDNGILFSPYQTIRPEYADEVLGVSSEQDTDTSDLSIATSGRACEIQRSQLQTTIIRLKQIVSSTSTSLVTGSIIEREIAALIARGISDDKIVNMLYQEYRPATQKVFYPLIADLFTIIGFNCHASRSGINYERWDAMAEDAKYSLPIEIKSPTEELNISVKAVRQALENKVILLSRKSYVTDWNSSTIAVGYNPPNDRAEVSRLITDIRNTFNIHVGIIDFGSLLKLAVATVRGDGCSHIDEIRKLEGMIDVEII